MADSRSTASIVKKINHPRCTFATVTRRRFIRNAALGAVGAAFAASGVESAFAGGNVGHITLDALLITYFGSPLGTSGSVRYTFRPNYSMTLGLRSMNNPDIALRA